MSYCYKTFCICKYLSGVENIADHWSQTFFYAGSKKKGRKERKEGKEK